MILVIRVVDKVNPDPIKNFGLTKRGDVVQILPDDHPFSDHELSMPEYRMLKVIDLTVTEAATIAQPEPDNHIDLPPKVRKWRCQRFLDLDNFAQPVKMWLNEATRQVPILDLTGGRAVLAPLVLTKPNAEDVVI